MHESAHNAPAWKNTATAWARRLFLDRHADFLLGELHRTWSWTEIRAEVVAVIDETRDTRTFVLRPNSRWRGFRAGQFTTVEVEVDGVRHRRCYSLSSAPADRHLSITVKRVPGGRVSNWLHDHLRPGAVLRLDAAAGDFVLSDDPPPRMLMVSGGSGVTPLMSHLRHLESLGPINDLVFVHYARSRTDVIFRESLEAMAARHPGLRLELVLDDAPSGNGGFDEARLASLVPDFAARATYLCGPPGLMERVDRMWQRAGASARLRREHFVAPRPAPPPPNAAEAHHQVRLTDSDRTFVATGAEPLLDQAERAGARPPAGCRMGICQTCRCRKQSGAVRNLLTGAVSRQPNEDIQLCISVPLSDVELAL